MNKWDELYSKGTKYTPLNEIYLQRLLKEIECMSEKIPTTIVDLGCGTGDSLLKFAEKGFSGFGFDVSEVAIDNTKTKLEAKNCTNFEVSVQDLDNFYFEQTADIVFCRLTYAFIKNKENFIETVRRIMTKQTVFVLATPVLYKEIEYAKADKPGIAVDFIETHHLFLKTFPKMKVFDHEYFGDKGEIVTFLMMK